MSVEITKAAAQSFDRGAPHPLFESRADTNPSPNHWSYVPNADGTRFLIGVAPGAVAEAPPLTVVVNWLSAVKK